MKVKKIYKSIRNKKQQNFKYKKNLLIPPLPGLIKATRSEARFSSFNMLFNFCEMEYKFNWLNKNNKVIITSI